MLPHDSSCFLVLVKFRAEWQLLYSFQTCSRTFVASDHFIKKDYMQHPLKARCLVLSVHGLRIPNCASQEHRMNSDHGHSQTTSCRVRRMTFSVYLHWPRKRAEPFHRLWKPTTFLSGESRLLQDNIKCPNCWHRLWLQALKLREVRNRVLSLTRQPHLDAKCLDEFDVKCSFMFSHFHKHLDLQHTCEIHCTSH